MNAFTKRIAVIALAAIVLTTMIPAEAAYAGNRSAGTIIACGGYGNRAAVNRSYNGSTMNRHNHVYRRQHPGTGFWN